MSEHTPVDHDDPQAWSTVLIGVIGMTLVIVTILLLEVMHHRMEASEFQRKYVDRQPVELRQVRVEQQEAFHAYRWVDKQAGVVAIPVERAMQLLVAESKRDR